MEYKSDVVRIGTRGSNLALVQTNLVIEEINRKQPELKCEIIIINTMGDKILDKPLLEFGGKGVFVTEFEEALINHEIDLAVHSAKDMPMELADGLEIVGVLKREDPRDVLISMKSVSIESMESAVIGTSSLRRKIQIEQLLDNVKCISLRGNVNTRLKKLSEGQYNGIILAAAGIKRLGLDNVAEYEYRYLDFDEMVPSGGQGIIAVEGRSGSVVGQIFNDISNKKAAMELEVERRALNLFGAGCHEPIGAFSEVEGNEVTIRIIKEVEGKIFRETGKAKTLHRLELVEHLVEQMTKKSNGN